MITLTFKQCGIKSIRRAGIVFALVSSSSIVHADLITFDFTGRLVVADSSGNIINNNGLTYTPINASLEFDTVTGVGVSGLSITMSDAFLGSFATFHDITMSPGLASNLLEGSVLVDWNSSVDLAVHVEWDATGLYNAIDYGIEVGDTISGTNLKRDGVAVFDVGSATPYSDALQLYPENLQGPAPLAATSNSLGITDTSTGLQGIKGYFDIGSGNSLHVTAISAVPVPAAVWLFGSGLIGLVGFAKRKKA